MSVYLVKGKGWRYDFTLKGKRHTKACFKTKTEAKRAEAKKREDVLNPTPQQQSQKTSTGMAFLDLVNKRLDHLKSHRTERYYKDTLYMAKRWAKRWETMCCEDITEDDIENHLSERKKVSAVTANAEIRALKALFNHGKKKKYISVNPVDGIELFSVEKKVKYIPPIKDIDLVIEVADSNDQNYLWVIRETMGRVSEINRMVWDDVNLNDRFVVLYTRKKRAVI